MGKAEGNSGSEAVWFLVILLMLVWWVNSREDPEPQPHYNPAVLRSQHPGYPDYLGYDLDCSDIAGPVLVTPGLDPHGLDGDHDGLGCE